MRSSTIFTPGADQATRSAALRSVQAFTRPSSFTVPSVWAWPRILREGFRHQCKAVSLIWRKAADRALPIVSKAVSMASLMLLTEATMTEMAEETKEPQPEMDMSL